MTDRDAPLTARPLAASGALAYVVYAIALNVSIALVVRTTAVRDGLRGLITGVATAAGQPEAAVAATVSGVLIVVAYLLILAPLPVIARARGVSFADFVGARRVGLGTVMGLAALVTVLGIGISAFYSLVMSALHVHAAGNAEQIVRVLGGTPAGVVVAFVAVGIVAPIAEECAFRGVLFSALRESWGEGWAIVASGVLFGVIHLDPLLMLPTALLGMVLARVFSSSRSLWASIACHATYNTVSLALAFLALRVLR